MQTFSEWKRTSPSTFFTKRWSISQNLSTFVTNFPLCCLALFYLMEQKVVPPMNTLEGNTGWRITAMSLWLTNVKCMTVRLNSSSLFWIFEPFFATILRHCKTSLLNVYHHRLFLHLRSSFVFSNVSDHVSTIPMNIRWKSSNSASMEDLLLGFFQFYSQFNFGRNAISVFLGKQREKVTTDGVEVENPLDR